MYCVKNLKRFASGCWSILSGFGNVRLGFVLSGFVAGGCRLVRVCATVVFGYAKDMAKVLAEGDRQVSVIGDR